MRPVGDVKADSAFFPFSLHLMQTLKGKLFWKSKEIQDGHRGGSKSKGNPNKTKRKPKKPKKRKKRKKRKKPKSKGNPRNSRDVKEAQRKHGMVWAFSVCARTVLWMLAKSRNRTTETLQKRWNDDSFPCKCQQIMVSLRGTSRG